MKSNYLPRMAAPVHRVSSGKLPLGSAVAKPAGENATEAAADTLTPSIVDVFGLPFADGAVGPSFLFPPLPFADDCAE